MRLLGKQRLQTLTSINLETDVWLSAWTAELTNAYWRDLQEVLDAYPKARQVDHISCIFFVCGNKSLGIKVAFRFDRSIAMIKELVSR